jgi:hypothetical protein
VPDTITSGHIYLLKKASGDLKRRALLAADLDLDQRMLQVVVSPMLLTLKHSMNQRLALCGDQSGILVELMK